jgi:hypothetical protein
MEPERVGHEQIGLAKEGGPAVAALASEGTDRMPIGDGYAQDQGPRLVEHLVGDATEVQLLPELACFAPEHELECGLGAGSGACQRIDPPAIGM